MLQVRVFEYADPGELFDLPEDIHPSKMVRVPLVLGPWPTGSWSTLMAVTEYILVLASIFDTFSLYIQISHRAILSYLELGLYENMANHSLDGHYLVHHPRRFFGIQPYAGLPASSQHAQ